MNSIEGSKYSWDQLVYPDSQLVKELARLNVRSFVGWCSTFLEFEDPVLDVACGYRNNRPEIDPLFKRRFISLDLNLALKPDFVADALHLPVGDEKIGCALCTEMLEHVIKPKALLIEVARVLKPNGLFIITVPCWVPIHEKGHWQLDYWRFTPRGLYSLLSDCFSNIRIKTIEKGNFPISVMAYARKK